MWSAHLSGGENLFETPEVENAFLINAMPLRCRIVSGALWSNARTNIHTGTLFILVVYFVYAGGS